MSSKVLEQAKQALDEVMESDFQEFLTRWRKHVESSGVRTKALGIDQESKKNLLTIRTRIFYDEINTLTEQMYTGQTTLGEYQETFKRMLRELHTSTAAIGKGGWDEMSSRDWGRTGPALKEQYRYLQGYVEYIDDNRDIVSLKQLQARARLYGLGGERTAVMIEASIPFTDLLPWLPKDGSSECLNGCKCKWLLSILSTKNNFHTVEAIYKLGVADHCKTCIERNNHKEVIRVPDHVEVPSQIGGY